MQLEVDLWYGGRLGGGGLSRREGHLCHVDDERDLRLERVEAFGVVLRSEALGERRGAKLQQEHVAVRHPRVAQQAHVTDVARVASEETDGVR